MIFEFLTFSDLLFLILTVAAGIHFYFKWSFAFWKRKNIPNIPPQIPFGNTGNPISRKRPLHETLDEIYHMVKSKKEIHGGFYFCTKPIYIPVEPDLLSKIFVADFHHFIDRGLYANELNDPLSANLFGLTGEKWKNLRAKLTPTFTSGKLKTMFYIMLDSGKNLIQHIDEYVYYYKIIVCI